MGRVSTDSPCFASCVPANGAPLTARLIHPTRPRLMRDHNVGEPRHEKTIRGETTAVEMDKLKTLLQQAGISFGEESAGRLVIVDGPDDYLIEVDPHGDVWCLFGVDMSELRLLVSGSSNEDLGEDELQRVAREHLRPLYRRYQPLFAGAGFEEEVVVDADSYAIAFVMPTAGLSQSDMVDVVRWCCRAGQPPQSTEAASWRGV